MYAVSRARGMRYLRKNQIQKSTFQSLKKVLFSRHKSTFHVQAALRRDVSHLRFHVLLRAPKTLVREKLKGKSTIVRISNILGYNINQLPTNQSLSIQTINAKIKYRIISTFNKKFYDICRIF